MRAYQVLRVRQRPATASECALVDPPGAVEAGGDGVDEGKGQPIEGVCRIPGEIRECVTALAAEDSKLSG